MGFITEEGLVQLKNYKYVSGGYSWLDNKINPFWVGCVELIPLWVAPNTLTFIGFVFMITSCAISITFDQTLTQDIPRWSFLFSAISIFVYQTLDAIDGKQARRTGSSSPLGQLFDHGCDSFVMTFFLLQGAQAAKVEKEYLFFVFLGTQIVLWSVNQKEHYTGILHTHVANVGVTEMELLCMFIQLITFAFGQSFWSTTLETTLPSFLLPLARALPYSSTILQVPCQQFVIMFLIPTAYITALYIFCSTLAHSKHKLRTVLEWVQLVIFWTLQFVWFSNPVYASMAGPILINFGIVISLIVCKLIICSTTKDQTTLFHLEAVPFEIVTLIVHFGGLPEPQVVQLFWLNFILTLLLSLHFLRGVINQITEYLGIYCFSIEKRKSS